MFGFFEKKYFVGVDFGTFSIKVVEVMVEDGKAQLVNFGIADIYEGSELTDTSSYRDRQIQYFVALLRRMKTHTKEVNVAIPGSGGLVAIMEFPKMDRGELVEAIRFEAHRYVPVDMNEVVLSWDMLKNSRKAEDGKDIQDATETERVILVAALKKDVNQITEVIKKANCSVETLELEVFSLARALVGEDPGTHLIIDIGFHVTNLVLVREGEVHMNRTVDVGGIDVTKSIADGMNISFERAEEMKKQKNFFNQTEILLTFPSVDIVLGEIQRMTSLFFRQNPNARISSLVLSGGSSYLLGLKEYFSERLKMTVSRGDPWKRIRYNKDQISESTKEALNGSLTVALGLALRGIEVE